MNIYGCKFTIKMSNFNTTNLQFDLCVVFPAESKWDLFIYAFFNLTHFFIAVPGQLASEV